MLNIDLKSRFKNKAFIVSLVSAIVLLIQQLGFRNLIPSNYSDIVNTLLTIGTMLGIIVDTSTPGINDNVIAQATVQSVNDSIETKEKVKTESSTTAINNTVTQDSASSKIIVDNPDNEKSIGKEVNAINATSPSAN